MKYKIDHDFHIHSVLSPCVKNPEQTVENILAYGEKNGFAAICLTDHFWDERIEGVNGFYEPQTFEKLLQAKPLPQGKTTKFYWGCETEIRKDLTLGITKERMDAMDIIIIPTTHMHMAGFTIDPDLVVEEKRAEYLKRLNAVLNMDLPFAKVGLAHLTCSHISPDGKWKEILDGISDEEFQQCFSKAAMLGVGIELNQSDFARCIHNEELQKTVLRPYMIAKAQGCKFYLGSDAHGPVSFETSTIVFDFAVTALGLTEKDKFCPFNI